MKKVFFFNYRLQEYLELIIHLLRLFFMFIEKNKICIMKIKNRKIRNVIMRLSDFQKK